MANNSTGITPIVRISQLPEENERSITGNPANTWFAIVNADLMKTKRMSLDSLLKYIASYLRPSESINYINIKTEGGLTTNNSTYKTVYLGNTITFSDSLTITRANLGYAHSNSAYAHANASFIRANNAFYNSSSSFIKANSAYAHANAAYNRSNSAFILNTSGGLRVDNTLQTKSVYLGNTVNITDSITYTLASNANVKAHTDFILNTVGGITGGGSVGLGELVTVDGQAIFDKANSSYNQANNAIVNPKNNFVTANGTIAYSNNRYLIIGNNLELTLQDNPKFNTYIDVTNFSQNETNVVKVNSPYRIHGLASGEKLKLDVPNISVTFCYVDATRGWVIV